MTLRPGVVRRIDRSPVLSHSPAPFQFADFPGILSRVREESCHSDGSITVLDVLSTVSFAGTCCPADVLHPMAGLYDARRSPTWKPRPPRNARREVRQPMR